MITHHGVHFGIFDLIDSYLICLSEFREWMQQLKYPFENVWLSGKRTQQTLNCWIASSPVIIFERKMRGGEEKRGKKSVLFVIDTNPHRVWCDFTMTAVISLAKSEKNFINLTDTQKYQWFLFTYRSFYVHTMLLRLSLLQRV